MGNAKLNIGDANGYGLEWIFRHQCKWGQYKDMEALKICGPSTNFREKVVIFAGAATADAFKKIRGNSYGMWIATEINLHHDNTIKEAFNRTAASQRRKFFWDMNPDHPKAQIYTEYIDVYMKKATEGMLLGGLNYMHSTIMDNINLTKERIEEIKSQYDETSIWYMRDILGMRVIAEGMIYRKIAEEYASDHDHFLVTVEEVKKFIRERRIGKIVIGVDFGGSGSGHAFVASTNYNNYEKLIALASEWHDADGTDPQELAKQFTDFFLRMINLFGRVDRVYCDSAEQVLIRGLKNALIKIRHGDVVPKNAIKTTINDRIFTTTSLAAQGRWAHTEMCDSLMSAISMAVWDSKKIEMERLDDGTTDIDSLDAFEYSYERDIKHYGTIRGDGDVAD